jgi:hypothetical protein
MLTPTALAAKAWYGRTGREAKVLKYYDTEAGVFGLQAMHRLKFGGLLWGTSHMHFRSCDKLKNLTFCFEPHGISTRPNLRDGL